ncbi:MULTISPECIES: ABC transporter ATP-binding protein [Streptococcus]|uniref:ABC transporter ATP-binding protein n=1 Tax=Streptococcus caledonicus TaxID=2614158 RepID=A0ABW0UBS8_9STRE|nr:ABC transporter ATP-binding protein [Streptococcus sp. S784/96/1]
MKTILNLMKQLTVVKGLFTLGVVMLLLATAVSQLSPLVLQQVIDSSLTVLDQGKVINQALFMKYMSLYTGLTVLSLFLYYFDRYIFSRCAFLVTAYLRNQAFDKMQRLPISYFDDKPAGKIATRIVNDTETLRNQFYSNLLTMIFLNIIRIIAIYVILIRLDVTIGLYMLILIPLFYGLQVLYGRATNKPMKDFYDARSEVNTQVNETMNGASLIQLYHQEEKVLEDFNKTSGKMLAADNRMHLINSTASWTLTEFAKYMVISGVLTVVGYQFLGGNLGVTPGRLFVYINYITTLFDLLGMLVRQLPNIHRSLETGRRVLDLLEEQEEADGDAQLFVEDGDVVFDRVTFAYEEGKAVLRDIAIHVKAGETVALVGHTGSGKSSIMNLLYRFYDPQEGKVLIDGQDIRHFSRESLRSYMGIVLQDPYLFTGTIASNVSMENKGLSDEAILTSLEKVGAKDMVERLDKGIHEPVVEKGSAFSSGERQLIAFARTLITDPKILILDEATSHIDTETEEIIQRAMDVVKEGRTTFIIAHRLSTIQNADQILVLDAGQIIERGTHAELLALGGRYAEMHKIQQRVSV